MRRASETGHSRKRSPAAWERGFAAIAGAGRPGRAVDPGAVDPGYDAIDREATDARDATGTWAQHWAARGGDEEVAPRRADSGATAFAGFGDLAAAQRRRAAAAASVSPLGGDDFPRRPRPRDGEALSRPWSPILPSQTLKSPPRPALLAAMIVGAAGIAAAYFAAQPGMLERTGRQVAAMLDPPAPSDAAPDRPHRELTAMVEGLVREPVAAVPPPVQAVAQPRSPDPASAAAPFVEPIAPPPPAAIRPPAPALAVAPLAGSQAHAGSPPVQRPPAAPIVTPRPAPAMRPGLIAELMPPVSPSVVSSVPSDAASRQSVPLAHAPVSDAVPVPRPPSANAVVDVRPVAGRTAETITARTAAPMPADLAAAPDVAPPQVETVSVIDGDGRTEPASLPGGRAAAGTPPSTVARVQRSLTDLGFDPGPVDGILGSRTREAVKAYQRHIGATPDGAVDTDLLASLGGSGAATVADGGSVRSPADGSPSPGRPDPIADLMARVDPGSAPQAAAPAQRPRETRNRRGGALERVAGPIEELASSLRQLFGFPERASSSALADANGPDGPGASGSGLGGGASGPGSSGAGGSGAGGSGGAASGGPGSGGSGGGHGGGGHGGGGHGGGGHGGGGHGGGGHGGGGHGGGGNGGGNGGGGNGGGSRG